MKKFLFLLGLFLTTALSVFAQDTCTYTISMHDDFGDGWNGAAILVKQGNTTVSTLGFTNSDENYTTTFTATSGVAYNLVWQSGSYDSECTFEITFNGTVIFMCTDVETLDPNPFFSFIGCSTCFPPMPFVTAVSVSDIDISWESEGNTQWEYVYGSPGFDPNGSSVTVYAASDTFVNIYGLNAATNYDFYIRSICDPINNQISDWRKLTFSMPQSVVGEIPYSTGFETGDDASNWTLVNGNNTNKWYIGTATHSTGSKALYISYNNGNSYSYDSDYESNVWAYRDIDLGTTNTNHMLTFDWKCEGYVYSYLGYEEFYDYMEVYIGLPANITNGVPAGATYLGRFASNTSWQQENILLSNQLTGIQRLYFRWVNSDWAYESYLPAAVDNISITEMNCGSIDSIGISAITTNSVTLTPYTANNASDFILYYKKMTDANYDSVQVYNSTDYILSNLSSGTSYYFYMKVDCGNDNYGFPSPVMFFTTQCDYITSESLPYTEGFESYYLLDETFPTCWHQETTYYNYYYSYPFINDSYYYGGDYSMYFNADTLSYNLAVLPEIDANLDVNTLTLSFMIRGGYSYYGASYDAVIGVMDTMNSLSTFVPVDTVTASSSDSWDAVDVSFENYTGNGKFIAFLNRSIGNQYATNCYYIDDVVLYVASDCKRPANVTASNITSDSATISWTPQGTETAWNVAVVLAGGSPDSLDSYLISSADSIIIDGLLGNTSYDVYVRGDCGNETSIWTSPFTFTTACSSYSVPFFEDFNANQMPPTQCWDMASGLLDSVSTLTMNSGNWYVNSTEISNGSGSHVYLNIFGTSANSWLISPSIDLGDGTVPYQLDLDVLLTNYYSGSSASLLGNDDIFAVVISTDNGNTWSEANAFIWDNDSTSQSYGTYNDLADVLTHLEIPLVDQNNMPYSGVIKIALYGESTQSNADNNLRVDNFAVNPLTNCMRPSHLTVSSVSFDEIEVLWTPGGSENSWSIAIVPGNSQVSDDDFMSVTDTFHTFTNLDANTYYTVYLQANCGSEASGHVIITAKTSCVAIDSIPYFEGFEDYASNVNSFPDCWTNLSPSSMSVYVYNYQVPSGSRALYFYTYDEENGLVVMPQFDPISYPLNTLQVNFSMKNSYPNDQMIVGYVTNPTDANSFVGLDTVNCLSASAESFEVPLNQCTATDAYIAFKTIPSPTAYSSIITLDDVSVDLIPDCPRPTDLHVTSSTINSVDLAWTPTGNESEWEIVYDITGFDPDNATPTSVYNPTFTATSLSDSLTYDFYVRAVCGASETSPWRGPISTQPGTYILPATGTQTITMCGGTLYDNGGPSGNYSTNCDVTIELNPDTPGMLVQLDGTYNIETGTSSRWDYLQIFDGNSTSGTLLFDSQYDNSGTLNITSISGSLTLYFHSDGSVCYSGFELHVNCVVPPTCPNPRALTASSTNTSVTLGWTEMGSATNWDIEYGTPGFTHGQGTLVPVTTNPYTINNLTTGTAYEFYVRANCGGGDESNWIGPVTSIPGAYIMPVSGQHSVDMCGGTIYDDGGPTGNYSDDCDVALVVNPDTPGMFVHLTGTFNIEYYDWLIIIDGNDLDGTVLFDSDEDAVLDVVSTTGPLTIYFMSDEEDAYSGFALQVSCESGQTTCNAPANITATNVTHESAVIDWTQEGTPDSWTISYKKSSASSWSTINTTTHPYTITNLDAETSYDVYVTATCGEQTSTQSATITFVTQPNSVNEYVMNSTLLYPNPTTGEFRIQNSELRIERVEVYDVYGKLMTSIEVDDHAVTIDASSFASGVYFTRVYTDKGTITKRIVKK